MPPRSDAPALTVAQAPELEPDQGADVEPEAPATTSTKPSRAKGKNAQRVGRTIYLTNDLFERIMIAAHRRNLTISDYVQGVLTKNVPPV